MTNYTDVMVDLETTGVQPDRNAIIQIAAVKFNLNERTVDTNYFERCLTVPEHRFWSEDTMVWWARQKRGVLDSIRSRQEPYRDVIKDFAMWAYPAGHLRFWAKPTTFDFMFCASYFADAGLANPFHYRNANDINSYLRGLHYPYDAPDLKPEFVGDAHNALWDTFHQIKVLFAHLDYKSGDRTLLGDKPEGDEHVITVEPVVA